MSNNLPINNDADYRKLVKLLTMGDPNHGLMAIFSAATGMHLEDVIQLTVKDVSSSFVYVRPEVGDMKYPIPLHSIQNVTEAMIGTKKLDELVFKKKNGDPYDFKQLSIDFENAAKQLNFENFEANSLRKYYFLLLWKQTGKKLELVQKLGGFETEDEAAEYIGVKVKSGLKKLFSF